MAERREAWRETMPKMDAGHLVFLDETWATTNMTRLRGRAPCGKRLVAHVPHGHSHEVSRVKKDFGARG